MEQREQGATKTHVRVLLILACVIALGTLVQDFRFDSSVSRTHSEALATDREVGSAEVALANFRAAETGYLATGQGPDFWMRQTTDLAGQLNESLTKLRAAATPPARAHLDKAAAALADLLSIDKRARTNIQNDQRFLASDLVFTDALDAAERISGELADARTAEAASTDARLTLGRNLRLGLNGLALALMFGVAAWLARPTKQPAASAAAEVAQMLRDSPPPVKPAAPAVTRPVPLTSSVSLPETADLCVDLARVMDNRDVPALLERTARLLEAKGVIVWVADKAGLTLRPAVTHGYPERVLHRLGALQVAADNVTSLSFRSTRPQTMNGATPGAPAAIAIPLLTASGCAGVLAAEIRDSKPASDTIAVAKIIAAQFATLIAPIDAEEVRTAQQA